MNYEEAKQAQPFASDVMKVLEGLEWECKICKHISPEGDMDDYSRKFMVASSGLSVCRKCGGKGKVKWSWTPQVGEWCILDFNNKVGLITGTKKNIKFYQPEGERATRLEYLPKDFIEHSTPILEWETIEGIFRKTKYSMYVYADCCSIEEDDSPLVEAHGKSRLVAVYKAVIELGKEQK